MTAIYNQHLRAQRQKLAVLVPGPLLQIRLPFICCLREFPLSSIANRFELTFHLMKTTDTIIVKKSILVENVYCSHPWAFFKKITDRRGNEGKERRNLVEESNMLPQRSKASKAQNPVLISVIRG